MIGRNSKVKHPQRGGVIVGIIIGIVIGLGVALAVAVYVTKVPVPFMNKSQTRTPEQDAAESRKNQNWDPNVPLQGRNPARPQGPAASGPVGEAPAVAPAVPGAPAVPPPAVAARPPADPLGELANARASASNADPFLYFVQAGAFRTAQDAEAQRAKLSLMGLEARVTEREQSGRQVFRVRIGPFDRKDDAEHSKSRLDASGFDTALVRVQR